MNAYELIRMLRQKLSDERQGLLLKMAKGGLDHVQYKDQCGYYRGISHCEDWLGEIVRALHDPHNERGEI